MEPHGVIRLPVACRASEEAAADVFAAIELVAGSGARRVIIAGLPGVESIAADALAYAQAAHVAFRLVREPGTVTVVVGPREP